jgi:hypothetical protein
MKIRVQRSDGQIETLTLVPPITIHYGMAMNHFNCGDGMDHYFNEDGTYDGWGRACCGVISLEGAKKDIENVETSRQIEPPET